MLTCSVRNGLVTANTIQVSFSLKPPPFFFLRRTPGSKPTKNIVWRRSCHSKRSKHPSRWAKCLGCWKRNQVSSSETCLFKRGQLNKAQFYLSTPTRLQCWQVDESPKRSLLGSRCLTFGCYWLLYRVAMAKVDAHQPFRTDQMITLLVCKRLFDGVCHGSVARGKQDLESAWPHESDWADI